MSQQPHQGEPLSLELVNTRRMRQGQPVDLFADDSGISRWLSENGFEESVARAKPALLEAREALGEALGGALADGPGEAAEARLNGVLAHGSVRLAVHGGRAQRTIECDEGWLPAWTAVSDYLELTETRPDRVRQCAHPQCVLYFHDTSRNGTRRWHSMDTCGARHKAARHYQRARTRLPGSEQAGPTA